MLSTTKQNLPAQISFKQVNGYYVVVEEVRNGQGELAFRTMFKKNGDFHNSNVYKKIASSPFFPKKGGNSLGDSNIIKQKTQNLKSVLNNQLSNTPQPTQEIKQAQNISKPNYY